MLIQFTELEYNSMQQERDSVEAAQANLWRVIKGIAAARGLQGNITLSQDMRGMMVDAPKPPVSLEESEVLKKIETLEPNPA